jgi:hypothetical protein
LNPPPNADEGDGADTKLGDSEPSDEVECSTIPTNLAGSGQDGNPTTNGSVNNPGYYRVMLSFDPNIGDQPDSTLHSTPTVGQWSVLANSPEDAYYQAVSGSVYFTNIYEQLGVPYVFGPESHSLTDQANQLLPFVGDGDQYSSTEQVASDIDTSTGEGFDDVIVGVTVQKLVMTVSDAANPSNSVTVQGNNSTTTPTLYVPANTSGGIPQAQIKLTVDAGGTPTDALTWSYSGDPASPNSGAFPLQASPGSSNSQTILVAPLESTIGQDVITVRSQSGASQTVDVAILVNELTAKTVQNNAVTGNLSANLKLNRWRLCSGE